MIVYLRPCANFSKKAKLFCPLSDFGRSGEVVLWWGAQVFSSSDYFLECRILIAPSVIVIRCSSLFCMGAHSMYRAKWGPRGGAYLDIGKRWFWGWFDLIFSFTGWKWVSSRNIILGCLDFGGEGIYYLATSLRNWFGKNFFFIAPIHPR